MLANQVAGRALGMARRVQHADLLLAEGDDVAIAQFPFRRPGQPVHIVDAHGDGSRHGAGDFGKAQQVILMLVGNQDGLNLHLAQGVEQLFRLGGGVNDNPLVGLGADHDIAVVVVGAHIDFGNADFAVIVQGHNSLARIGMWGMGRLGAF